MRYRYEHKKKCDEMNCGDKGNDRRHRTISFLNPGAYRLLLLV